MPNWCHNTLTVKGDPDAVRKLVEAVKPDREKVLREREEQRESMTRRLESMKERLIEQDRKSRAQMEKLIAEEEQFLALSDDEFYAKVVENQPLSFESIVPMPAEKEQEWYEWNVSHWGTKWDANFGGGPMVALGSEGMDVKASTEAQGVQDAAKVGVAVFKFDTAWSPPIPVVNAASDQHPELEFELLWGEVGADAAGRQQFVAGVLIDSEELSVEEALAPEEMWF